MIQVDLHNWFDSTQHSDLFTNQNVNDSSSSWISGVRGRPHHTDAVVDVRQCDERGQSPEGGPLDSGGRRTEQRSAGRRRHRRQQPVQRLHVRVGHLRHDQPALAAAHRHTHTQYHRHTHSVPQARAAESDEFPGDSDFDSGIDSDSDSGIDSGLVWVNPRRQGHFGRFPRHTRGGGCVPFRFWIQTCAVIRKWSGIQETEDPRSIDLVDLGSYIDMFVERS